MKNLSLILLGIILFASCKKGELPGDNGCISVIKRYYISGPDSIAAVNLFKQNHIPYANLAFDRVILNDTINTTVYQHVFSIPYFNGLPVLFEETGYHFKNGVFQSHDTRNYTQPSSDTRSALNTAQLRELYLKQVNKNDISFNMKDSCLVAEHGYYDLNIGTGNNTPNLVKVWLVTPKHVMYPQALFRDNAQGELLYYFNGWVTFSKARQSPSLK